MVSLVNSAGKLLGPSTVSNSSVNVDTCLYAAGSRMIGTES